MTRNPKWELSKLSILVNWCDFSGNSIFKKACINSVMTATEILEEIIMLHYLCFWFETFQFVFAWETGWDILEIAMRQDLSQYLRKSFLIISLFSIVLAKGI
jgi:hypothetical protein